MNSIQNMIESKTDQVKMKIHQNKKEKELMQSQTKTSYGNSMTAQVLQLTQVQTMEIHQGLQFYIKLPRQTTWQGCSHVIT